VNRAAAGGFKTAASVLASAWPIVAGLVTVLVGYIEVRSDNKIATASNLVVDRVAASYISRVEWEARRQETDRRLDEEASNDRLLADRLSRIEATMSQMQLTLEAIKQAQLDDRRNNHAPQNSR
jgi:hypothetical protein